MKLTLVATCMFGLEKQVGEEIDALDLHRLETMDGRVTFEGEEADVARANLSLRCAERVFIRLGYFPAHSFTELFDGTNALPWEEWIGREDAFPVKGHSIRSALTSIPDCQSIVKKAVVERLKRRYRVDWFRETGVKYQIEFFLFKDMAALMLDTSGTALHKRGYSPAAGAAPLRETLVLPGRTSPACRTGYGRTRGRRRARRCAPTAALRRMPRTLTRRFWTRSTRTPCVRGWNST